MAIELITEFTDVGVVLGLMHEFVMMGLLDMLNGWNGYLMVIIVFGLADAAVLAELGGFGDKLYND